MSPVLVICWLAGLATPSLAFVGPAGRHLRGARTSGPPGRTWELTVTALAPAVVEQAPEAATN